MKSILRALIAVIAGLLVGGCVNMALVLASPHVIPPPAGVDVGNMDSMRAGIHLFEPKHFLFPFLAHALGTLAGALVAGFVVAAHRAMRFAVVIGMVFLAGGVLAATMIPAPRWFVVLDLLVAYIPMAWLGGRMVGGLRRRGAVVNASTLREPGA
ncbi:MAG: hypothetical protein JNL97_09100 [Verrucomicrobiales bacterium]|nr:hypothetical protein [Verrucomicrobiales bacterium]